MSKDEAIKIVIEVIKSIAECFGEEDVKVTAGTMPIGGIKCFDSLTCVVATADCLERCNLESNVQSLFVGKNAQGPCALTIEKAADKLIEISEKNQKTNKDK